MRHLKPYNELFGIFKKRNEIDVNDLPDEELLSELLISELPDGVDFIIDEICFRYDKNGNPELDPNDYIDMILSQKLRVPMKNGYRRGYIVHLSWSNIPATKLSPRLDDITLEDVNKIDVDKFKDYGIRMERCHWTIAKKIRMSSVGTSLIFYSI